MVRPLGESQGSPPLQGHGSWLMCEVALSLWVGSPKSHISGCVLCFGLNHTWRWLISLKIREFETHRSCKHESQFHYKIG